MWPVRLPSIYGFQGGVLGTSIRDGGMDMYDYGNELRVRVGGYWSNPLQYTQVCDGSSGASVQIGDAKYATCKYEKAYFPGYGAVFVTVVTSARGLISGFMTNGNVGADGGGKQRANNGTVGLDRNGAAPMGPGEYIPLVGRHGTSGYWKQIYHAQNDPSVNHLIFAQGPGAEGAESTIGTTTDNDLHQVRFFRGPVHTLYYVLWAGKNGYEYQPEDFHTLLDALGASCLPEATYFPNPDGVGAPRAGSGGGGGFNFGTFLLIVFILVVLVGTAIAGYMWYKGTLPKLFSRPGGGRSQTTPMPTFDAAMGPISTSTTSAGRVPLASADSAVATPYLPPPAPVSDPA